jgi:hypothetical protein
MSTISAGNTVSTAITITGDTTGNLVFQTQAGTNTVTVPNGTGTMVVNNVSSAIVSGTAANATSTSVDFTGIPSWVKRITVMFDAVSTSGTSNWLIQLGDSGGIENTGYISVGAFLGASTGGTSYTAGFGLLVGNASHVEQGLIILSNLTGNVWTADGSLAGSGSAAGFIYSTSGAKTLSATLDRVRITTVNGTDTFDAGTINIFYE